MCTHCSWHARGRRVPQESAESELWKWLPIPERDLGSLCNSRHCDYWWWKVIEESTKSQITTRTVLEIQLEPPLVPSVYSVLDVDNHQYGMAQNINVPTQSLKSRNVTWHTQTCPSFFVAFCTLCVVIVSFFVLNFCFVSFWDFLKLL